MTYPQLWSGTSGLVFSEPNKQSFPPAFRSGSRLAYYAHIFNSLEVNSSFYKVPKAATFEKWAADTPDHFRFTIKLWRGITHVKDLAYHPRDLYSFLQAASRLGDKKGCLLVQFPPSITPAHAPRLTALLNDIAAGSKLPNHPDSGNAPTSSPWRIAVEFRHPGWYAPQYYDLLANFQASLVLHDMPASKIQTLPPGTADFVYLRFHGILGDYKGGYTDQYLQTQAGNIQDWLSSGKDVFAYFNNTIGDAIHNCKTLTAFLRH